MIALFCLLLTLFASAFKSKSRLEAENAALRHQLCPTRRSRRAIWDHIVTTSILSGLHHRYARI
jgi:hypothetical protein